MLSTFEWNNWPSNVCTCSNQRQIGLYRLRLSRLTFIIVDDFGPYGSRWKFFPDVPSSDNIQWSLRSAKDNRWVWLGVPPEILTASTKTAAGPDQISNICLWKLPRRQITEITNIISSILTLQHYPRIWNADIIVISKRGTNPRHPNSYRPISCYCQQSANHITARGVSNEKQFWFRPWHSTIKTTQLANYIYDRLNRVQKVGAIVFDISKAFDKVSWQERCK